MAAPGKNCAGIYTYGKNNTTTANGRVTVTMSDTEDTYGYNGIFVDGVSKLDAKNGIELTIDSTGDNNASGVDQAWRNGPACRDAGESGFGNS